MEEQWGAWHRGELSNDEIVDLLAAYATLKPLPGEEDSFREGNTQGGYFGVHDKAVEHLGAVPTQKAFDLLCDYAVCGDRLLNYYAAMALKNRGDARALSNLMRLLELEDERFREDPDIPMRNPHLLTCHVIEAIVSLEGPNAVARLNGFLSTQRAFEHEIREKIAELEK